MPEWLKLICCILGGISTAIPLLYKMIQSIRTAIREKNWGKVVSFVLARIEEAEGKFSTGEERKDWVMMCVKAAADTFDYDIDMQNISDLIDALVKMSKKVNVPDASALNG